MPQALEVGPALWEYWDEATMLLLLASYVRDQLQTNPDDVGLERLFRQDSAAAGRQVDCP
jgi:hypothetical protein